MTNECRIKYIQYLQCNYSDLAQSLTDKAKLGRKCKELETKMLVVREYIKSLYCYNAGQGFGMASKVCIQGLPEINEGPISCTLTIDSTVYNYTLEFSPDYYTNLYEQIAATDFPPSTYVYKNNASCFTIYSTSMSGNFVITIDYGRGLEFSGDTIYTVPSEILDKVNCLTEKEMCGIVNHAFELVKDCKECC